MQNAGAEWNAQILVGAGIGDGAMGQPALRLFSGDDGDSQRSDLAQPMPAAPSTGLSISSAFSQYHEAKDSSPRTVEEYDTTLNRLDQWAIACSRSLTPIAVSSLDRQTIKDFLDWVYAQAVTAGQGNPGRTVNKRREHLRAVLNWLHREELTGPAPRFPDEREQRDATGLFFLDDAELDSLYWATYQMPRPHAWTRELTVGAYWRAGLAIWLTYGVDTQTLFAYDQAALPIRWKDIYWEPISPDRRIKDVSEWGWLFYRRKKTDKPFMRPMSRCVSMHLRAIAPKEPDPEQPVLDGAGGSRPCKRFQELVQLAGIQPKVTLEDRKGMKWNLKDLRKTCATRYEKHMPGTASVILGHAIGARDGTRAAVTFKHYANVSPLEFLAITTLPVPTAFTAIWDDTVKPKGGLLFAK